MARKSHCGATTFCGLNARVRASENRWQTTCLRCYAFTSRFVSITSISKKIADQDVNFYRDFSWQKDQKERTPLNVDFQNTATSPVTNAPEAIALAVKECNVEYTKIVVYRDEAAGMWRQGYCANLSD